MRFSKMHFRKSKRALWIFTPSEMRLQSVKKTKFLKNSLRREVVNSPQPFSSSCSSLHLLHSMGGGYPFFSKTDVIVKKLMFGVSLGIGALTDRNHGCRPGCYGVSLGSWQTFSPHLETLDRMSHQGAGKKYHGTAFFFPLFPIS